MNKLISCDSCGRDISISADSCPGCGARNEWVDPRIKKLQSKLIDSSLINSESAYRWESDRNKIIVSINPPPAPSERSALKMGKSLLYSMLFFMTWIIMAQFDNMGTIWDLTIIISATGFLVTLIIGTYNAIRFITHSLGGQVVFPVTKTCQVFYLRDGSLEITANDDQAFSEFAKCAKQINEEYLAGNKESKA